ncbi:hypothetical protein C8R48DRAFT_679268 [Suillus tomentosus]|nr:hypothetical protein C8R48DRAFT_679268 [Suillus tomentosus]
MSTSQHANAALDAAMEDIRHLMVRLMKLQVGHPNTMVFAHEITKIIAKSLREHGEAATSFSPMLLSCAAEICDHCDTKNRDTARLVFRPHGRPAYCDSPTIHQDSLPTPPTIATPPPAVMAPSPILAPAPIKASGPAGEAPKFNLFVAGTKRKAEGPGADPREDDQVTKTKRKSMKTNPEPWEDTARLSKRRKVVRSKKFVSDDESADGEVIIIKRPGTSVLAAKNAPAEHVEPLPDAGSGSTISILTDVNELQVDQPSRADSPVIRPDDWSDDDTIATTEWPSQRLHPSICVRCIKEDRPCLVRLGRKIGEVCKTCPACEDKKVKCVRLIPKAEDALRDIVAKKKAATASKAAAKEKKSRGRKPAKSTSCAPAKRLVSCTMQSAARLRVISPTENDPEDDIEVGQSADVDTDMHAPMTEPRSTDVQTVTDVQHSLVDVATEGPVDDAGDNDMQFPQDDFEVEADTPLINLHTPLDLEVPVPSVQPAPTDPPAEAPSLPSSEDIEDTARPLTSADAPPAAADPAPVILLQVTARDLLLGMEALGRRIDNLQVSNNQAQGWHAQMGKRVSNLEIKTLNNSMISGNLAGLINSIRPPNNPNPSFAPPPISGSSTSPYGALPPAWFPGNPPAPAPANEPSVSHIGRRYTHTWDESHVSPKTLDPAVVPSMTSVYVQSGIMYDISAAMDNINAMTQSRYIIIREHMTRLM